MIKIFSIAIMIKLNFYIIVVVDITYISFFRIDLDTVSVSN